MPKKSDKPQPEALFKLAMRLYNQPLLIDKSRLDALLALIRTDHEFVTPEAFFFFFEEPEPEDFQTRDGIAWIQIHRSMLRPRTYLRIRKQIESAIASANVRGILLDIDSPGGEVHGLFDLADFIFQAREEKPIWAIANGDAFSAAYAIASGAERISVTRTGGIGSVGIIAVHVEFSKADEAAGVKFTPIFSGERKADLIDSEPLNDTARQLLQDEVDRLRTLFVETVARNRDVSTELIRDTEAGVFFGPAGVPLLADQVENIEEVFEAFQISIETGGPQAHRSKAKEGEMFDSKKKAGKVDSDSNTDIGKDPEPKAEIINLDAARAEARKEGAAEAEKESAARAAAIRLHCDLSHCPERFGEFLDSDLTPEQVGKKILDERATADRTEVHGQHGAGNGSDQEPVINAADVYARRRISPAT